MKLFFHVLTVLLLTITHAANAPADIIDRIVVIINDDVITLSEVNEEGKLLLQRVVETVSASERDQALQRVRQTIIEKLIEKKIMQQEARKNNISVSDEDVSITFDRILVKNNTTIEQFRAQLATAGLNEAQYRANLKDQILSSKLVNSEIRSKIIIPEDRIIDYYDTHYTERVGEGGFYILQIGISPLPDEGGKDDPADLQKEARQEAERIRSLAVAGEDFRALAREHSNLPSSVDGGDIGIFKKEDMSADMLKVISETKPGEITDVIETSSGFQFFKILSSQEGQIVTKVPYESVKDEIHETLYQEEMRLRFTDWLQEKKDQAYIKIM